MGIANLECRRTIFYYKFSNADRIYEYYCLLGLYGSLLELGFEEIYERREAYKYKVNYTKFEIQNRQIPFTLKKIECM